jgi:hypothetical protein
MFLFLLVVHSLCYIVLSAPCDFVDHTVLDSGDGTRYVYTTNFRSTHDIVRNCIFTILLCTWFSLHPNVRGYNPHSTIWQRIQGKLELFAWALFIPEAVLLFACNQWLGANAIVGKMKGTTHRRRNASTELITFKQ